MMKNRQDGMGSWKLGLGQMRVVGGEPELNLQQAVEQVGLAAGRGAQLVLLPEALDLGWTHPAARDRAATIPEGEPCCVLSDAARRHGIYVCAGLVERSGDRVFNAAVLLDRAGHVVLHHRKLNELEIGHDCYAAGDRLGVVRTELGTLGLMICADGFARGQVIGRTLGLMEAQVILCPSAWAVPADHDNEQAPYGGLWRENFGPVARDYRLWIAAVSNVGLLEAGPWAGRRCIGCSMVVGPDGGVVLKGPYGERAEALLECEVRPMERPARGDGWERLWTSPHAMPGADVEGAG
jgi:predicted amidohydrolase